MSFPITPVRPPVVIPDIAPAGSAKGSGSPFQSVLSDAIRRVDDFQRNAQSSIGRYLAGEDEEVHKVALASQEAEMTFDLFLQMRNKVVSAYQEVMRMQM